MRRLLLLAVYAAVAAAHAGGPAQSPYGEAVAARFAPPAVRYDTPALQPGRSDFTRNDELAAVVERLARQPGVRRVPAGRSQRGVPIEALHFSRGAGRPTVLLLGQQHGDEPAAAEALLALAGTLAASPVLDHIDVLLLPRANPDGAAAGRRSTADGRDMNRDHLLLQTPEARAVAALVRAFDPIVVADLHEYTVAARFQQQFGAVQKHDLLLQQAGTPNLAPALLQAGEDGFLRPLRRALDAAGLSHEAYHTPSPMPGDLRLAMGGPQPDTLRNVQGLAGRVSLLVESRGAGLGRLHLERRVHALVVAVTRVLESAAAHAAELQALRRTLAQQAADQACRGSAVVLAAPTAGPRSVTMLDPATGADREVAVTWLSSLELRPLIVRERPCGYWLAPEAEPLAERLREAGLVVRRLEAAERWHVETWRETARSGVTGRLLQVTVETERQPLEAPAGSWVVTLAQPLAPLAFAALEPDSPGSFYAHRLLPSMASVARIVPAPPLPAAAAAPEAASAASAPARAASEQ